MHDFALPIDILSHGNSNDSDAFSPLTVERILASPRFQQALCDLSGNLLATFQANPRLCRALGSHQRWLLSQAAFALHFEYHVANKASGLTVGRLRDLITPTGAASRNTVLNFIEEMRHYRYVRDIPHPDGGRSRRRRVEISEQAEETMATWFRFNIALLDQIDGGERQAALVRDPGIFRRAQPVAARRCLEDKAWLDPPVAVGLFQWTESGGLVMDELMARCGRTTANAEGRYNLGTVNIRAMADAYLMSHTHLQRLFRKAAEMQVIGWEGNRRKAELWVSADFLDDYRRWQAAKLVHLDHAFHAAVDVAAP
nr:hypothetical protein [uncultured Gellertiella sp.]